ncbi:MAG: hypothetical protein DRO13_06645 [Thermoprotei archaeon]|nr:MAG: hypothetical protein DRO13_06645 [Thermoprotei archaeon]
MIREVVDVGVVKGFAILRPAYVWLDYIWLLLMAYLFHKGSRISRRIHGGLFIGLGVALIYFAILNTISS